MELKYKIQIKGKLTLETGMHIGGSEVELDIGGIDKAVVKDKSTVNPKPYIPGSSLKGKLRDLIARKMGYPDRDRDVDETFILFGDGAKDGHRNTGHLIVRDAFYLGADFNPETCLEEKAENTIDRITGGAKPRNIERVVRGAVFGIDMVLDIYNKYGFKKKENNYAYVVEDDTVITDEKLLKTLKKGFRLLENDYLGGSGTRGYGKVSLVFDAPQKIEFNTDGTITTTAIDFDFNLGTDESH